MRCKQIIDFNNMKYNINKILEFVPIEKLMLVVKANAYGHGYDKVVRFCYKQGVKWFAVATYEEAIQVYKLNLPINILILGPTECENFKDLEEKKIHFCVTSFPELEYINKNCSKALYHIAFDTGMGRIGFNVEDVKKVLEKYKPIGLFTHLSVADVDPDFSHKQLNKFLSIAKKYKVKYVHALNSYGTIKYEKDPIYTLYRVGIMLYGGDDTGLFKPTMSFYARVSYIKKLEEDSFIGYGNTYVAKKGDIIATVSCGYADGLPREVSNNAKVYCKGKLYNIIGNICMDQFMIKVDENIKVGDFVEIYGEHISIQELAKQCETITYEIFCRNTSRSSKEYRGEKDEF